MPPTQELAGPVSPLSACRVRTAGEADAPVDALGAAARRQTDATRDADGNLTCEALILKLQAQATAQGSLAPALRQTLLDCLQAVNRLHAALVQTRGHGLRLDRELRLAQADLAAMRSELAGTQARERAARRLAQHDPLTALPNRRCFGRRLDDALHGGAAAAAPALAVLYLDLDGFKSINDRHGHDAGDELLRIVARRLRCAVRSTDLVCRLGGDEFACLLADDLARERIADLAAKLFAAVAAPLKVGALELQVRPSIGIAVCPTDGCTASTLLSRADAAMYRAKRRQLGFAFFDRQADA